MVTQHLSILFTRVNLVPSYPTITKGQELTGITPIAKSNRAPMHPTYSQTEHISHAFHL
jgi:hypothetical protein